MKLRLDDLMVRRTECNTDAAQELDALAMELGRRQREVRSSGRPVIVLFEGWEAAGKGTLINRLAMALDPRSYRVITVQSATPEERLRPPLYRYWRDLPGPGRFVLYDRSWYDRIWTGFAEGKMGARDLEEACEDVRAFEKTLVSHGYTIVKYFLHIKKREQARRFRKLKADKSTTWRIDESDLRQHRHYDIWRRAIEKVMTNTGSDSGGFYVIDAGSRKDATILVFRELTRILGSQIDTSKCDVKPSEVQTALPDGTPSSSETPSVAVKDLVINSPRITNGPNALSLVDLSQSLELAEYESKLDELQEQLRELEHRIYKKRIGVVIGFEGWDAAGKGGAIRRLVSALDPRGYEVVPISAPTTEEARMHYLFRFAKRLPKGGHITLFDRTWYGRVLVERVEGFCSEANWRLAYEEIRAFENHLVRSGNVLVKFWLHIDAEEQLRRFHAREQNPEKSWKITDEDWRNREKRLDYDAAVADMIELTSTSQCPWTIIPANNKLFARISAMQTVAAAIAARLKR
jgi:polyphosphate kinase 2 (PPK2 family)